VVQRLPSMREALGLIAAPKKKRQKKKKKKERQLKDLLIIYMQENSYVHQKAHLL
jgi:hypothetical protein